MVWTYLSQIGHYQSPVQTNDIKIVFWNTAHLSLGLPNYARRLRAIDAPLIALVEADSAGTIVLQNWARELPEYNVVSAHFGGLIAFRGTLHRQQSHQLHVGSWCDQFDLTIQNQSFTLLLVDVSSQLSQSRRQPLQKLGRLVKQLNDRPILIVGDFNTPDDSIWFDDLRQDCRNVFREFGNGFAPTWPVPLPVLALDQVWANRLIVPSTCSPLTTIVSDHRAIVTTFSVGDPQPQR